MILFYLKDPKDSAWDLLDLINFWQNIRIQNKHTYISSFSIYQQWKG
jgi:hypothetical protein